MVGDLSGIFFSLKENTNLKCVSRCNLFIFVCSCKDCIVKYSAFKLFVLLVQGKELNTQSGFSEFI